MSVRIRCIWWVVHAFDETFYRGAESSPCIASFPLSFFMTHQPLVGQGFLIVEASWLHSHSPHCSGQVINLTQTLCLTAHNTHKKQISMGFEPASLAIKQLQTHASDLAVTGISLCCL
jgi:hypothetical protein